MWYSVDCAVQGVGHEKTDTPCQDKTCIISANGVNVIALADGAGSAPMSHFGAETVVNKTAEVLCSKFDEYFADSDGARVKTDMHKELVSELVRRAGELECSSSDLASTLLAVAVKNDRYIIAHIGDGVIGYLKNDELKVASEPQNGEFSNETVFVTSANALYEMRMMKGNIGDVTGLVLMSDGSEASLYNKKDKYLAPVLKKIMRLCTLLPEAVVREQLKNSFEAVIKKATQDDCSIAFLVKGDCEQRYFELSNREKLMLLQINPDAPNARKRLMRYENMLELLQSPCSVAQVSRFVHVRPKHTKKQLDRLLRIGFVEKRGGVYYSFLGRKSN